MIFSRYSSPYFKYFYNHHMARTVYSIILSWPYQMQPKLVINKGSRKFGVVNPRVKSCVDISRKVSSLTLKLLANGVADDLVPVDLGPGDRELPS